MNSSTDRKVGLIGRAHGIRGEVSVRVSPDDLPHFDAGSQLEGGSRTFVVAHSRPHKNTLLVDFEGVSTRNDAEDLRGIELTVPLAEPRDLAPGEYWPDDLIGLTVEDAQGPVGEVVDVIAGEVQDRLVVRGRHAATFEVPFVDELVPEVNPAEGYVRITPIEGLYSPPGEVTPS